MVVIHHSLTGQIARRLVEEENRLEPAPVQTLNQNLVGRTAQGLGLTMKKENVTLKHAQVSFTSYYFVDYMNLSFTAKTITDCINFTGAILLYQSRQEISH